MTSSTTWADPARTETLTTLWKEGYTASQIARKMGLKTRNIVIGRLYRLGLTHRDQPSSPAMPKAPRLSGAQRRALNPQPRKLGAPRSRKVTKAARSTPGLRLGPGYSPTPKPPIVVPDDVFAPLDGLTHRPWTSRRLTECKWPIDIGDEVHSCCRPTTRSGYCATHAQIAFRTDAAIKPKDYERSLRRYA